MKIFKYYQVQVEITKIAPKLKIHEQTNKNAPKAYEFELKIA